MYTYIKFISEYALKNKNMDGLKKIIVPEVENSSSEMEDTFKYL